MATKKKKIHVVRAPQTKETPEQVARKAEQRRRSKDLGYEPPKPKITVPIHQRVNRKFSRHG